jgi:hypothetical protein
MLLDLSKSMEKALKEAHMLPVPYLLLNGGGQPLAGHEMTPVGNFKSALSWYNGLRTQYQVMRAMFGVKAVSTKPILTNWTEEQILGAGGFALIKDAWERL